MHGEYSYTCAMPLSFVHHIQRYLGFTRARAYD